ncbi:MAG: T9SS type A sorting domain-containing protein, partial [Bacteroidota bacterium]|nr:T9SS type A sorting domain-containing protein [Bacteroidota bacterium]
PQNDIHAFTAIAQDPRPGFQDTWYAGGGEAFGNTASEVGAEFLSYGLWKSTDNGSSWTKLPLNNITDLNGSQLAAGTLEVFDHPFDFVHKIAINPVNGDVYVAGHRRLMRTSNGGTSFQVVFAGSATANSAAGQMDVIVSNTGRVLVGVNGGNPDLAVRGVWTSPSGNRGTFTRIAGGQTLGVDSVAGWRGNSYNFIRANTYDDKRILLSYAPSNQNIAYVFYENELSNSQPDFKPEADLFQLNFSGSTVTWDNRSANLPDLPSQNFKLSDPLSVQRGYNMLVTVKPDNPNTVFIGGTNLYRSTDGFRSNNNTAWINGYHQVTPLDAGQYPNGHPDQHVLVFNPSNSSEAICGDDGGIRRTTNIMAGSGSFPVHPVSWSPLPNYQTVQYYYVAIDPTEGRNNFVGGAQDNGVLFRDKSAILPGTSPGDSNNHKILLSADGASVGISSIVNGAQYVYESIQYGRLDRHRISPTVQRTEITPAGLTTNTADEAGQFGEFVTNFSVHADNPEDLYYVNFNRLFRTTSASTVTSNSGWTELTGVSRAVNPANPTSGRDTAIRALGFPRGPYTTTQVLYIGTTRGKIFRLDDPRNVASSTTPIDITPAGLSGNVQDIAVNPNNENEVLAVVSNYSVVSIWWTNNGKAAQPTWRNAEGNLTLPSIRSCVIVVKKDAANNPVTEYYVGTSIGLYSTTDLSTTLSGGGSPTWQREGGNVLNYAVIQDMAYRPTDNVLLLGTHGNGMYYTFLGTPNFTPNGVTGDTVVNDKNFIKAVYPTISNNSVQYTIGNIFTIKKMSVQVANLLGQIVSSKETGYQSGEVNITNLATGHYFLIITSDDRKYRHIQRFIKK